MSHLWILNRYSTIVGHVLGNADLIVLGIELEILIDQLSDRFDKIAQTRLTDLFCKVEGKPTLHRQDLLRNNINRFTFLYRIIPVSVERLLETLGGEQRYASLLAELFVLALK